MHTGQSEKKTRVTMSRDWWIRRALLVLWDILSVNLSYFLALVVRFYVHSEFRAVASDRYLPAFQGFAPFYTVLCLGVFVLFRLYNSRWRVAGLHDLNRILAANAVTTVIHVLGTLIFFDRMPVSYYIIGALVQCVMFLISRFSYKILSVESVRLSRRSRANLNVMLVGVGETARMLRRQIESDHQNLANPVCMFSWKDRSSAMLDGLPVLNDLDSLPAYFEKYQVRCVILADSILPEEIRDRIREACKKANVEVQDFSGYMTGGPGLTPGRLLEYAGGPVTLVKDGARKDYRNSEEAAMAIHGSFGVRSIRAEEGRLVVELETASRILDTQEAWVRKTEQETGEEISFF